MSFFLKKRRRMRRNSRQRSIPSFGRQMLCAELNRTPFVSAQKPASLRDVLSSCDMIIPMLFLSWIHVYRFACIKQFSQKLFVFTGNEGSNAFFHEK
jgi:hypothetical protein